MRRDVFKAVGQMHAFVRRRALPDRQSGTPFLRGPDRPRRKTAAAVRAYIVQLALDAVRTEGAFVAADARLRRMRRKILVAIFAVRSKLQRHGWSLMFRVASLQIERLNRMTNIPRFRTFKVVIPGCASWRRPGIHTHDGGYGFRAHSLHSRPGMTNEIFYRIAFSGSFCVCFSRSSTIDERTWATLWCGISTLLTMSDRLLRSRSTAFNR
jgi:hypothetical protein